MRHLASIQKIEKLFPIEGADKIEGAVILGWNVVVKKEEFKEGDACIYIEIDSFIKLRPEFEFLRKSSYRKLADGTEGYRLRTCRLRGQISQGLALPVTMFPGCSQFDIGTDVTEQLDIIKYEPPIPACLAGEVIGNFPGFLFKTDETRIQSVPTVLERHQGKLLFYTEKLDGSSCSIFHRDGEFGVCSRNLNLRETPENTLWKVARANGLEEKLKVEGNFAIQGEVVGEGVQGNKYKLRGQDLYVFQVFNIDKSEYLKAPELWDFCEDLGLKRVPYLGELALENHTVSDLVQMASIKSKLNPNVTAEGLVFRSVDEERDIELGRLSFKVINPNFLLEHDE